MGFGVQGAGMQGPNVPISPDRIYWGLLRGVSFLFELLIPEKYSILCFLGVLQRFQSRVQGPCLYRARLICWRFRRFEI